MNKKRNREVKKVNASAYLWNKKKKGAIEDYKLLWGIVENLEKKKVAVKFILEFNEKKIAMWITDLLSILTMQKMLADYIGMKEGKEEDSIEQLLPKLTEGVNMILSELRKWEAKGKQYEQIVLEMTEEWNLTQEQSYKVLCLLIASTKLVEDLYLKRAEQMDYIY